MRCRGNFLLGFFQLQKWLRLYHSYQTVIPQMRLLPVQLRRVIGPLRLNVLHEHEGVGEKPPAGDEGRVEKRNIPRLNLLYFQGVGKAMS